MSDGTGASIDPARSATDASAAAPEFRSFLLRLALVVLALGVPILGTSYFFVSQVSSEIATSVRERDAIDAYERVAVLFPAVEAMHRAVGDRDRAASAIASARLVRLADSLADRVRTLPLDPTARNDVDAWVVRARGLEHTRTLAAIDAASESLRDLGSDLEGDSVLDYDPSHVIQNLSAAILRQKPQTIVAMRRAIDAVAAPAGTSASVSRFEAIAAARVLLVQPIQLGHGDVETAVALDPTLAPSIEPLERDADRATRAVQRRLNVLSRRETDAPADARAVERLGRVALDAQDAVWRRARVRVAELVDLQYHRLESKRRTLVAVSFAAVLLGAAGIVAVGRHMRKRDRIQLAASHLEGARLRAEVARLSVERALRLQEAQFRTVFESAELGIAIFDDVGNVIQRNPALARMLTTTTETDFERQADAIALLRRPGAKPFTVERCVIDAGERTTWLALTFSGVYDDGVCRSVVLLVRDATEEKTLQRRLLHDATHDALTGLANRAAFESALREHVAGDARGEPYALLYVDLDSFKQVNDTHGHAAGDRVLVAVSERLVAAVASSDLCARLGGDEFALLVREVTHRGTLASIASRIGRSVAAPIDFGDVDLAVSASIGIALGSAAYTSTDRIKHDADLALYAVKSRGRDGYAFACDLVEHEGRTERSASRSREL